MSSGGGGETPIEMLHHPNSSSTTAEGEGTAERAAPCFPETGHDKNASFQRVWVRACLVFSIVYAKSFLLTRRSKNSSAAR